MQDDSTDDSPWHDPPPSSSSSTTPAHAEAEWTRLSSDFQNAGYRDGITAGKEGALQQGFDAGFAQAGAPRGRELGVLRGIASALLLHLSRAQTQTQVQQAQAQSQTAIVEEQEQEQQTKAKAATARMMPAVREILDALAAVRFADIAPAPPPEEAEHTHTHTHGADDAKCEEEEEEGGDAEAREGGRSSTSAGLGPSSAGSTTTTIDDVRALRVRLEALLRESGLDVNLNLESPAA